MDILVERRSRVVRDLRLGLIANASSVTARLEHAVDALRRRGYNITCLFAPEHGLWGATQDQITEEGFHDRRTGIKVYSLYAAHRQPTAAMLKYVDAVVYDVQDIGARYYTFVQTMALAMEACAQHNKLFIVLDRPNPINGVDREGPMLDPKYRSFVGLYPVPIRHGLTAGELAGHLRRYYLADVNLHVVRMRGWKRQMWFDQTTLPWVMPSPNMPTLDTATVYPGLCLLEGTNVSEGRGTTRPFETFGAPWVDPYVLRKALTRWSLPGVDFRPLFFRPTFHKFRGQVCGGLQIHLVDRDRFRPVLTGVAIVRALRHLYPRRFAWLKPPYEGERDRLPFDILAGSDSLRHNIEQGKAPAAIERGWRQGLAAFRRKVSPSLLYR